MASLVIDTSALLAVLLNEPTRPALIQVTEGHSLVGAPSLPWEVGNALIAGVRRKRLSAAALRQVWASYRRVPVRLAEVDAANALEMAIELQMYAYDAYVLETARTERLRLLTLDRGMERAARQLGVRIVEYEHEGL
jgi:predicted nucleic acid-binding protein